MKYQESISGSRFLLFIFISTAVVVEVMRSGKLTAMLWKELLPQSGMEWLYFILLSAIFMNTLNWIVIYVFSFFNEAIMMRTDYVYLILSVIIFITSLLSIGNLKPDKDNLFVIIAAAFSAYTIYQYYSLFKRNMKNVKLF